jgi:hypothetical protein
MNQMKGLTFVGLVKCYNSINVIVLFHDPFLTQIHSFLKLIYITFITNHSLHINERSRVLKIHQGPLLGIQVAHYQQT